MKFFWRYVWNKMREIGNEPTPVESRLGSVSSREIESDEGLNIVVRTAIGGRIVSFRHYDKPRDRTFWKTYIIPEDQDFEQSLGKIITLESLR